MSSPHKLFYKGTPTLESQPSPFGGAGGGRITLTNIGKRYNREWIFRHFNYTFSANKKYAITGPNGSGKSTLLQVIAGAIIFNEGDIQYTGAGQEQIPNENIYRQISIAAPYLELIEEMTANEFLSFHSTFKPLIISNDEILKIVNLEKAAAKQIRYFSSGMKQRLKLAQAFFCSSPVLLLDEPATNLDIDGIALYRHLITNYTKDKIVIISSNDKQEYDFCDEVISVADH